MSGNQANQTSDAYLSNQLNESVQHNVVLHHRTEAVNNQRAPLGAMRDGQNLDGQRPTQSVGSMVARYENLSERSATNATPGVASRSIAEQTPAVTTATTAVPAATPTATTAAPATAPATATTQSQQQSVEQLTAENAKLRAALAVQTAPVEVPSTRLQTIAETAEASARAELSAGLWQRPVVVEKKPQVDEYGFWAKVE